MNMVKMGSASKNVDFRKRGRAPADLVHTLVFACKKKNMNVLEKKLHEIGDPYSRKYRQHMTRSQVFDLIGTPESKDMITSFLKENDITITKTSRFDEYITAEAPLSKWEEILHTKFHHYEHKSMSNVKLVRTPEYSLPEPLAKHVSKVFNTVQFPEHMHMEDRRNPIFTALGRNLQTSSRNNSGFVDPNYISVVYEISDNTGSSGTTQAIYARGEQTFSPADLTEFQTIYDLPDEQISQFIGGFVDDSVCIAQVNNCSQANLDAQYITSVAQGVPTIWYHWNGTDPWLEWIVTVADMETVPDVFVVNYVSYEDAVNEDDFTEFNDQAIILSSLGVTLVTSAGDDGVAGFQVRGDTEVCDYFAMFPSSNPYFITIGGTMGPEDGNPEIACQASQGGRITTGGGFSAVYDQLSHQNDAVSGYFETISGIADPAPGFDSSKRAYPDLSLMANNYILVIGGNTAALSATSAAADVFAAMVSLVNSELVDLGGSTLGWINPTVYDKYWQFTNDITSGNNSCLAQVDVAGPIECCTEGFTATEGWDPVSGFGSINFDAFKFALVNPIFPTPTIAPTRSNSSSSRSGWLVQYKYDALNCNGTVLSQEAEATGICISKFDEGVRRGSKDINCVGNNYRVRTYDFPDSTCSSGNQNSEETFSRACVDNADGTSYQYLCQGDDKISIVPLPDEAQSQNYVVRRGYDTSGGLCRNDDMVSFNSYLENQCFQVSNPNIDSTPNSVIYRNSQPLLFDSSDCTGGESAQSQTVSYRCENVDFSEPLEPQDMSSYSSSNIDYATSNELLSISTEENPFGLSDGEIAGIVIGAIAFFIVCCGCIGYFAAERYKEYKQERDENKDKIPKKRGWHRGGSPRGSPRASPRTNNRSPASSPRAAEGHSPTGSPRSHGHHENGHPEGRKGHKHHKHRDHHDHHDGHAASHSPKGEDDHHHGHKHHKYHHKHHDKHHGKTDDDAPNEEVTKAEPTNEESAMIATGEAEDQL